MIEIIHCNAMMLDPDLLSACDVQITDFPYSPHVHANTVSNGTGAQGVKKRDLGFDHLTPELRQFGALVASVLPRWSIVFSDLEGAHHWREDMHALGVEAVREMPHVASECDPAETDELPYYWQRWSQPQLSGDRPPQGAEAVLAFHPMRDVGKTKPRWQPIKKRWNGNGGHTGYNERCMRGKYKHTAEKPLDLMLSIVAAFSDPGEAVVDLCAGYGTTALACRLLGRDCVALEIDSHNASTADARVKGPLSNRDHARAVEWCERWHAEASAAKAPTKKSEQRTYERAQRRLVDVERVREKL